MRIIKNILLVLIGIVIFIVQTMVSERFDGIIKLLSNTKQATVAKKEILVPKMPKQVVRLYEHFSVEEVKA